MMHAKSGTGLNPVKRHTRIAIFLLASCLESRAIDNCGRLWGRGGMPLLENDISWK